MDALEHIIEEGFRERGYYFLGGVTPPFRGPYIWKNMESLQFDVELPGTIQPATVHMMYDFIMESWIGFATCAQKHVGGCSKEDGIYCNAICYPNREGEDFQVSYLKHEAQHFYDQNHFPELQSTDIEYRAKLVELIYRRDHTILRKFFLEAGKNPDFSHTYAAYLILQQLSERVFNKEYEGNWAEWLKIDYSYIASMSLKLYKECTEKLKKWSNRTSV